MSTVRVLVGTRKGAFILTSDGKREKWDISGPHFAGWEMYHLKGSPADPNRIYASQTSGWFGQVIQRSDDGGKTWHQPGTPPGEETGPGGMPKGESNKFVYDTSAETGAPMTTHQFYDGKPHPWEFKRVWHLEPSLTDPGHGLRRGRRRGDFPLDRRREELARDVRPARTRHRPQLAAGRGRHVPAYHYSRSQESAADLDRHFGRGRVSHRRRRQDVEADQPRTEIAIHSRPGCRGRPLRSSHCDESEAAGSALHAEALGRACAPTMPATLGHEVSGNLPTDFGFAIDVHAHEPETIYVVPITSDGLHFVH